MRASHLIWLGLPLLNTLFQLFAKLAAEQVTGSGWVWLHNTLMSSWTTAAVATEAVSFVIWMRILAELDLSRAFPLSAISYILILAASWLIFAESISLLQLIGSGLILTGVWLISTAGREALPEAAPRSMQPDLRPSPPRCLFLPRSP